MVNCSKLPATTCEHEPKCTWVAKKGCRARAGNAEKVSVTATLPPGTKPKCAKLLKTPCEHAPEDCHWVRGKGCQEGPAPAVQVPPNAYIEPLQQLLLNIRVRTEVRIACPEFIVKLVVSGTGPDGQSEMSASINQRADPLQGEPMYTAAPSGRYLDAAGTRFFGTSFVTKDFADTMAVRGEGFRDSRGFPLTNGHRTYMLESGKDVFECMLAAAFVRGDKPSLQLWSLEPKDLGKDSAYTTLGKLKVPSDVAKLVKEHFRVAEARAAGGRKPAKTPAAQRPDLLVDLNRISRAAATLRMPFTAAVNASNVHEDSSEHEAFYASLKQLRDAAAQLISRATGAKLDVPRGSNPVIYFMAVYDAHQEQRGDAATTDEISKALAKYKSLRASLTAVYKGRTVFEALAEAFPNTMATMKSVDALPVHAHAQQLKTLFTDAALKKTLMHVLKKKPHEDEAFEWNAVGAWFDKTVKRLVKAAKAPSKHARDRVMAQLKRPKDNVLQGRHGLTYENAIAALAPHAQESSITNVSRLVTRLEAARDRYHITRREVLKRSKEAWAHYFDGAAQMDMHKLYMLGHMLHAGAAGKTSESALKKYYRDETECTKAFLDEIISGFRALVPRAKMSVKVAAESLQVGPEYMSESYGAFVRAWKSVLEAHERIPEANRAAARRDILGLFVDLLVFASEHSRKLQSVAGAYLNAVNGIKDQNINAAVQAAQGKAA